MNLGPGDRFPDLDLPDHTGRPRLLSEVTGGDPIVVLFSRGWWCPKEQRHLREMVALQRPARKADCTSGRSTLTTTRRVYATSNSSSPRRVSQSRLESDIKRKRAPLEEDDTSHRPYRPTAFTLFPDLTVHRAYDGYWYWGRPTQEDLRQDMRAISLRARAGFKGSP